MTPSVIVAPRHGRYAPCRLTAATQAVPSNVPDFESIQRKAGLK